MQQIPTILKDKKRHLLKKNSEKTPSKGIKQL